MFSTNETSVEMMRQRRVKREGSVEQNRAPFLLITFGISEWKQVTHMFSLALTT